MMGDESETNDVEEWAMIPAASDDVGFIQLLLSTTAENGHQMVLVNHQITGAQEAANTLREGISNIADVVDRSTASMVSGINEVGEHLDNGLKAAGESIQKGMESAGDNFRKGMESAGDNFRKGMESAGRNYENGMRFIAKAFIFAVVAWFIVQVLHTVLPKAAADRAMWKNRSAISCSDSDRRTKTIWIRTTLFFPNNYPIHHRLKRLLRQQDEVYQELCLNLPCPNAVYTHCYDEYGSRL